MKKFKEDFKEFFYKPFIPPTTENFFYPVEEKEIEEAEKIIDTEFPSELREFYKEIGTGRIVKSKSGVWENIISNYILPPLAVAHFYKGIVEHHQEAEKDEALCYDDHWLALETLELLQPGDLPFFEIGDSSSFMVMKLNSDNPNAVWFQGWEVVEDSFERFIHRLYYESPSYYNKNW